MKKLVGYAFVICFALALFSQAGCEFTFGEKQDPILHAVANPGVKTGKKHTPEIISNVMSEDLSDKGWKKKPTAVYDDGQKVNQYLNKREFENTFRKFSITAVTQIPYYNDVNSEKTVTLTFYHMETPFDAWSLFSLLRQEKKEEYAYGEREVILRKDTAIFWEGPFLVTVSSANLEDDTKDVLLGVSKGIAYKLYGLIGTYDRPDMVDLFPLYQKKEGSVQRVLEDPFGLPSTGVCMKAEYLKASGKTVLYIVSDPSQEKILQYRALLFSRLFLKPAAAVIASVRNRKGESTIWVNSPEHGVMEIAQKKNVLAIQAGLGPFRETVKPIPGLKDLALTDTIHSNLASGIELNTYKDMIVIDVPDSDANDIIMMGITVDVLREVK